MPEDYKLFLESTNGIRHFPLNNPAFLPVSEIRHLKDVVEPYFFEAILDHPTVDGDPAANAENLSKAVIICEYSEQQTVWLIPIDKELSAWQAWFYAAWLPGVRIYPSFRFYMEEQLTQMEAYDV